MRRIWSSASTLCSESLSARAEARSWPNGFSIITVADAVRSARPSSATTGANSEGGISR